MKKIITNLLNKLWLGTLVLCLFVGCSKDDDASPKDSTSIDFLVSGN